MRCPWQLQAERSGKYQNQNHEEEYQHRFPPSLLFLGLCNFPFCSTHKKINIVMRGEIGGPELLKLIGEQVSRLCVCRHVEQ